MSQRYDALLRCVQSLYEQQLPTREAWADWLWPNHVQVVTRYAGDLAKRYGADEELAQAAALLHDCADTCMSRFDDRHEAESISLATRVLSDNGYTTDEIAIVVDDAIRLHSCRGSDRPTSLEGKVLATADALAHFKTDFYLHAAWSFGKDRSLESYKEWALKKLDKDMHNKLLFEAERLAVATDYSYLKSFIARSPE